MLAPESFRLRRAPVFLALALIRAYQLVLSPWIGKDCRHLPTCSHFASDAIRAHGLWAGGWMSLARLIRCRPGGSRGYDPAPTIRPRASWWAPWGYGDWRGGERPEAVRPAHSSTDGSFDAPAHLP